MVQIENEIQYNAVMARIEELLKVVADYEDAVSPAIALGV